MEYRGACRRGAFRPYDGRSLPTWNETSALAPRQGAAPMHLRAIGATDRGRRSYRHSTWFSSGIRGCEHIGGGSVYKKGARQQFRSYPSGVVWPDRQESRVGSLFVPLPRGSDIYSKLSNSLRGSPNRRASFELNYSNSFKRYSAFSTSPGQLIGRSRLLPLFDNFIGLRVDLVFFDR